ncbi:MAG: TrkA family potassium uptake protein [Candidatus Abyssobacteria bacterium SURF_17]|jgi:trk system potassium uptake protein TrkA|uniref:TrkA family potassium uptake protein n=1 Tax=Candidatus Abyssobacteria bacterium SURF_17 TaxID=2093361 RepID=A0A419F0I9_9BACT|nr:MAG: TrkA family potassium uptake protein [Candidatus Abyssubacteria bacterium SURF_17]
MFVVIIGCGRLGSRLAIEASKGGMNVVVVDKNKRAFDLLTAEFSGFQVVGDASNQEVLRSAKISDADIVAAVTDNDNVNLMVAQAAKHLFGVGKVLARVTDPLKAEIYAQLGLKVLCPATVAADAIGAEMLK